MKSSTYGRHTDLRNHSLCPWHELWRSRRPRPARSEQEAKRSLSPLVSRGSGGSIKLLLVIALHLLPKRTLPDAILSIL